MVVFDYYNHLKKCGFEPIGVLDVGANRGEWTIANRAIFPLADYLMIEGNDALKPSLAQIDAFFEISLVGNYTGEAIFYLNKHDMTCTGNSMFKENTVFFEDAVAVTRPISTIDEIVARREFSEVNMIKLDIQGAEVEALKGAQKTLETVEVIQTEVSFMNYNQGSPAFFELHMLMYQLGFAAYGISEILGDSNYFLVQMDTIWVKRTSKLWDPSCTHYPNPYLKEEKVISFQKTDCQTDISVAADLGTGSCDVYQCLCSTRANMGL
jgi:FkbM family methyltransferase